MNASTRRLILANGEKYLASVEKKSPWGPQEMPRTYGEARDLVKTQVRGALETIAALPRRKRLPDETVLCLRLHPDMIAKTYDPKALFSRIPDLENVGSRSYRLRASDVAQTTRIKKQIVNKVQEVTGRLVFIRSNDNGFRRLLEILDLSERSLPEDFKKDIQRIERFDALTDIEQQQGFDPEWNEGRVELVLHPSRHSAAVQATFLEQLFPAQDVPWGKLSIAPYPNGPTFISCRITKAALTAIVGANPLRAAHPFEFGGLKDLRGAPAFPAPQPPITRRRSNIKIGMFDGGINPEHPLLKGHAEQDESLSIKGQQEPTLEAHGTAVAGALLYGPLNGKDSKAPLPAPLVSVVSFRALPTSDPADINLYECIDLIEATVPARKDIKAYNLSFGPRGPIQDDSISRFTYALDTLAATHKVAFYVAVGNDGEAGDDLDRIQCPSDIVNGIGVGAYTQRDGKHIHAPYSCKGHGRECAKVKPDIVAFGGCEHNPIHLVGMAHGQKVLSYGTSFASPISAALGGLAAESFDRGTPLLARALLIHTAEHPDGKPDRLLGHGIMKASLEDILRCEGDEVTILFQGDILPTEHVQLPIMLPTSVNVSGTVQLSWTVAALPPVNPNHPSDYTSCCIEDTFYPDSKTYNFRNPNRKAKPQYRTLHIIKDATEVSALESGGWKRADFPVSKTGNQYRSEKDRRALDCKWEPIVRRSVSMYATSVSEPCLILHAMSRNGSSERLAYAAIVTISAPKCEGDLYGAVLRRFPALQPIRLRTEAEIQIEI